MKCAFARTTTRKTKNENIPAYITNCGYYTSLEYDISISREKGRDDFQLLIPISGEIEINEKIIKPGYVYIYYPYEKQHYTYKKGKTTEYFWVHFEGTEAFKYMNSLNLTSGIKYISDNFLKITPLLKLSLNEIYTNYEKMDDFSFGIICSVLTIISNPPMNKTPYNKAVKLLSEPETHVSVSELAEMYKISIPHFIRCFKKATGYSPVAFRTEKMLELSLKFLSETSLTINKISQLCGYDDCLYFSRIFKNRYGIPPSEYRKKHLLI